jgi:hypothetical protein
MRHNSYMQPIDLTGAPGPNRTADPPLRRGMLYPLSYGGIWFLCSTLQATDQAIK